jgi:hypothetical protein
MRPHQFGRIENLRVEAGQPILRPDTKIVRVARIGGAAEAPEVADQGAFELKAGIRDLLGQLEKLNTGTVLRLEFRHGMPSLLETEAEVGETKGYPLSREVTKKG